MDDSTESDVLYEACSILMRLSARSIKGIRADIDQIELPSLSLEFQNFDEPSLYRADKNGNSSSSSSSLNFVPLLFGLFALGLIGAAARNERIQGWTLLLSRILRRLIRKVKTYVTRLIVTLGPVRKGDLLNLHMKSPGSTWDLRSSTEQSACFALQGRRPKMEDRFTLVEKLGGTQLHLFAIYDGHGGEVRNTVRLMNRSDRLITIHSRMRFIVISLVAIASAINHHVPRIKKGQLCSSLGSTAGSFT